MVGTLIMSSKYRIVIAEDHTILREGLRALLSSSPDFDIVGELEMDARLLVVLKN